MNAFLLDNASGFTVGIGCGQRRFIIGAVFYCDCLEFSVTGGGNPIHKEFYCACLM